MLEKYAGMFGRHAADVLRCTSGLTPVEIVVDDRPQASPIGELAVGIDFQGCLTECAPDTPEASRRPVSGCVLAGSATRAKARPWLAAMTRHLGLDEKLLQTADGPTDILSEYLNIVVGLAGADWSEHGFDIRFSTPKNLGGQTPPALAPADQAFHIAVAVDGGARVDFLIVFRD